jgi:hypothetical protein
MTSPYVVEAVGDPTRLHDGFTETDLAADFQVWQGAFGLGMAVDPVPELRLPGYTGSLDQESSRNVDSRGGESPS